MRRIPLNRCSHTIIFLGCAFLLCYPSWGNASHNCPSPPKKGGAFGLFITTTFLPSATAAAVTRSFNTSGCKNGHPSETFYKPDTLSEYLKDNLDFVAEEMAQGQGNHIRTLAMLMGCPSHEFSLFAQTLRRHYTRIFPHPVNWPDAEQAVIAQSEILRLIADSSVLQQRCIPL